MGEKGEEETRKEEMGEEGGGREKEENR